MLFDSWPAIALANQYNQASCDAGRVLTTAELRRDKPDRHAFTTQARRPIQVVLDGVRQSYNLGALFRLCDAYICERLVICGPDGTRGTRNGNAGRMLRSDRPARKRERLIGETGTRAPGDSGTERQGNANADSGARR